MKKNFRTFMVRGMAAMLCASAFIAFSCGDDKEDDPTPTTVAVTGVTLDKPALTLGLGETATLKATVAPENATDKTVSWESNTPAVATVTNAGKVTAVGPGTATVTVVTTDGKFTAECAVTVTAGPTVTGVTLEPTTLTIGVGKNATLTATVAPDDAYDKSVTWASSDPAVATVADGVVTGVADGTATITVTTVVGEFTAECAVTVKSAPEAGTLMFEDSFENGLDAWTNLDQDGDGFIWKIGRSDGEQDLMEVYEGVCCAYSESFDNGAQVALTPDNWLISPAIELLGGEYILSWWVTAQDPAWLAEKYAVLVGTSPTDVSTFTSIFEGTVETGRDYRNKTVDLSAYAGQTIYIAFRHYDVTDMFAIDIDYVQVFAGNTVPSTASTPIPGPVNVNMASKAVR